MKVLQVNVVYNTGSTGKIVSDIHTVLMDQGVESIVCYGRGKKTSESNVYKSCSEIYSKFNHALTLLTGVMYGGCFFSTKKLECIIQREKPDIVHLHCLNGYFVNIYALVAWLKKNKIKTVLTQHAEFMYTANCGYALECDRWKEGCGNCPRLKQETGTLLRDGTSDSWRLMRQAFMGFNDNLYVVSVSPWLMERSKSSPILADKKHKVIFNGLDDSVFHCYDTQDLRKKHGIKNEKIIFHATSWFNPSPDHIKGGYYILKLAEELGKLEYKIIVAGSYNSDIMVPDNVIMLGKISDQKTLAQYYSMADVTVLTSKKETFSMITAESLCCGTPVAGFVAGAPEQIALKEYSRFSDYGDMASLKRNVMEMCSWNIDERKISEAAHGKYRKEVMCQAYLALYNEMLGESDCRC